MVTLREYVLAHKTRVVLAVIFVVGVTVMAYMGTLSYPYIMLDRQIQSLRQCTFGKETFDATTYGFRFTVTPDLCILPHRIFPDDGSIQIVPKGFYFVISEYAKGTVTEASQGTFLFERRSDGRTIPVVMQALEQGGFLSSASTTVIENVHGVTMTVVRGAHGIDPTQRFDWAFAMNGKDDILLSVLARHSDDEVTFRRLLDSVELLP